MAQILQNNLFLGWQDARKNQSDTNWTLLNQHKLIPDPYQAMGGFLQAMSNAALMGAWQQLYVPYKNKAVTGIFNTVYDEAVINVRSVIETAYLVIPAPKSDIFVNNGQTFNVNDPRFLMFVRAAKVVLGDSLGNPWTEWGPGFRRTVSSVVR